MSWKTKVLTEKEYLDILNSETEPEPEEKVVLWDSNSREVKIWTLWEEEEEEEDEDEEEEEETEEPELEGKQKRKFLGIFS